MRSTHGFQESFEDDGRSITSSISRKKDNFGATKSSIGILLKKQ